MGKGDVYTGVKWMAAAALVAAGLTGMVGVRGVEAGDGPRTRVSREEGPLLPAWAGREFRKYRLHESYTVSQNLDPVFYRGDFDGDGRIDCAALVRERTTDKLGVVIFHRRGGTPAILGAGRAVGNGGDDWTWLGRWQIVAGERVPGGRAGGRDALLVEKPESAGGIVFWNGSEYAWVQHGD